MKSNKFYCLIADVFILFLVSYSYAANPALQKSLEDSIGKSGAAVLIVHARTGQILGSIHGEFFFQEKHAPGSLMKVFTLLARYSTQDGEPPVVHCPATLASDPEGCWNRNGHGRMDAVRALAFSCNVYFKRLARGTSPKKFAQTLRTFELIDDEKEILNLPEPVIRRLMVGSTLEWKVTPVQLLRAYSALFNGGRLWASDGVRENMAIVPVAAVEIIRNGMWNSVAEGTSLEAGKRARVELLGKTGTSLLQTRGKIDWSRTQGTWIGLYPERDPEVAVMTFVPNGRGASDAAPLGGTVLSLYLQATNRENRRAAAGGN